MPVPCISASTKRSWRPTRPIIAAPAPEAQPSGSPAASPPGAPVAATPPGAPAATTPATVGAALAANPRVMIDTPSVGGSIDLKGGKIDDIVLKDYHETVDPKSPNVRLFSPPGAPDAYWAETGFVSASGSQDSRSRHALDRRRQNADARRSR